VPVMILELGFFFGEFRSISEESKTPEIWLKSQNDFQMELRSRRKDSNLGNENRVHPIGTAAMLFPYLQLPIV